MLDLYVRPKEPIFILYSQPIVKQERKTNYVRSLLGFDIGEILLRVC